MVYNIGTYCAYPNPVGHLVGVAGTGQFQAG